MKYALVLEGGGVKTMVSAEAREEFLSVAYVSWVRVVG